MLIKDGKIHLKDKNDGISLFKGIKEDGSGWRFIDIADGEYECRDTKAKIKIFRPVGWFIKARDENAAAVLILDAW